MPVLMMAYDTDGLRQKNVLNPIEEGDGMPLPVVAPINNLTYANPSSPPSSTPSSASWTSTQPASFTQESSVPTF